MTYADPVEFFMELDETDETRRYMGSLVKLRGGLYLDPAVVHLWSCDPARCRPLLGPNLCCKVQVRCADLIDGLCSVHEYKPFSCALFPIELFRIGAARVVAAADNGELYARNWTRYDRDMLRCFDGEMTGNVSMFEAQRPVLERVFTQAEMAILEQALEKVARDESTS